MGFDSRALRVILLAMTLGAGCHDKEGIEGPGGEFPWAPAGLAFSVPRGELAFFRPDSGNVISHYTLADWPVTNAAIDLGNRLIVTDGSHSRVGILSLPELHELTTKTLGGVPVDMKINSNGSQAYVITHNSNLWVYYTSTDLVDTLEIGVEPRRISLRPPLNQEAWITCPGDCSLYVIDLIQIRAVDTLYFDIQPSSVAFSPDGAIGYIALSGAPGTIESVDATTRAVIGMRDAGTGPFELAISNDGRFLAAGDSMAGRTRIWDLQSGNPPWNLPGGGRVDKLRYSRGSNAFFMCVSENNSVFRIGLAGGHPSITDTITVAPELSELTFWEQTP